MVHAAHVHHVAPASVPAKRVRLSITAMQPNQLASLRQAFSGVLRLQDDRGYQFHAGIHGLPLPKYCKVAHGRPLFLAWHRAYLYTYELALADQVPGVALPWWDWRTVRTIPTAFAQAQVDGAANPLYSVRINDMALQQGMKDRDAHKLATIPNTFRQPGLPGAPPPPTTHDMDTLLNTSDFFDFQQALEQSHNDVHVWVGGHMADIAYASYDPLFWAHHTMIDRVWRLWQMRHPQPHLPTSFLTSPLPPFPMTVADTLDVTALGYDYAVTESAVVRPG
jgi:tyrosinase